MSSWRIMGFLRAGSYSFITGDHWSCNGRKIYGVKRMVFQEDHFDMKLLLDPPDLSCAIFFSLIFQRYCVKIRTIASQVHPESARTGIAHQKWEKKNKQKKKNSMRSQKTINFLGIKPEASISALGHYKPSNEYLSVLF